MFNRIADLMKPKAPTDQFVGTYEGHPANKLATIEEGKELQALLFQNVSKYKKSPGFVQSISLLAINGQGGHAKFVQVSDMISAKFPQDKPIALLIEVEQGAKTNDDDDIGGEESNPRQTEGQIMFNVRDTIESILKKGEEVGLTGVFTAIDRAADVASRGGIAKVVQEEIDEIKPPPAKAGKTKSE